MVTPVIDVLDDETLRYQYSAAKATSVGGFDWNLQFNWHAIPERERSRRARDVDPVRYVIISDLPSPLQTLVVCHDDHHMQS